MRGRTPKSTALRIIEGNRGHRPINTAEPKPESKAPARPRILKGWEIKGWKYLVRELEKMGTLATSDLGVMIAYCHWFGNVMDAKDKLSEPGEDNGKIIKTTLGNLIQNPWLGMANTAAKELAKVSAALGLDPTSRTRIKLEKKEPQSKRERLLG